MTVRTPFADDPVKRDILAVCDHGQATGDWNPLLKAMHTALHDRKLHGPFFYHSEMVVEGTAAYNWCIVEIDTDAVEATARWLRQVGEFEVFQQRYKRYFGQVPPQPAHFPAQILTANESGNAGHPAQLAWFLDQYLPNINKDNLDYVCGIELISSWESRFTSVYWPAAQRVLDKDSQKLLTELRGEMPFSTFATLYATLHDSGHWLGSMACLPESPVFARYMPNLWYAMMGELATDTATIALLFDLAPSAVAFILTSRLFDYMYRELDNRALQARLNQQDDTFANALLFERLRKAGGLIQVGDRWHLEIAAARAGAHQLMDDLNQLGAELIGYVHADQTELIEARSREFIRRDLSCDDRLWQIPPTLQPVLDKLEGLPLELKWSAMRPYYRYQHLLDEYTFQH
ncbi:MAG: hypothetical protein ACYDBJ_29600 [Aggregatilineales bacterium]